MIYKTNTMRPTKNGGRSETYGVFESAGERTEMMIKFIFINQLNYYTTHHAPLWSFA